MSLPLKTIAPAARREEFGQQVEAGRLAGAIRPDERVNGAAPDPQIDIAHGDEAARIPWSCRTFREYDRRPSFLPRPSSSVFCELIRPALQDARARSASGFRLAERIMARPVTFVACRLPAFPNVPIRPVPLSDCGVPTRPDVRWREGRWRWVRSEPALWQLDDNSITARAETGGTAGPRPCGSSDDARAATKFGEKIDVVPWPEPNQHALRNSILSERIRQYGLSPSSMFCKRGKSPGKSGCLSEASADNFGKERNCDTAGNGEPCAEIIPESDVELWRRSWRVRGRRRGSRGRHRCGCRR